MERGRKPRPHNAATNGWFSHGNPFLLSSLFCSITNVRGRKARILSIRIVLLRPTRGYRVIPDPTFCHPGALADVLEATSLREGKSICGRTGRRERGSSSPSPRIKTPSQTTCLRAGWPWPGHERMPSLSGDFSHMSLSCNELSTSCISGRLSWHYSGIKRSVQRFFRGHRGLSL